MNDLESLKYPVGKFNWPSQIATSDIEEWIVAIEKFPQRITSEAAGLSENELSWKYRPDGWTIRQVVHHCADSHFNSVVRFKLALTEETPTIKPYEESAWALLADSQEPIDTSIKILEGLHARWVVLLRSLNEKALKSAYFHPAQNKIRTLDETIGLYAWHCDHHLAHIRQAKAAEGKY